MKKVKIFLVALITVLLASGAVLAANWPNMQTGTTSNSGTSSGGGYGYRCSSSNSRTRYTLYDHQQNKNIVVYTDTKGINGNTATWFAKNGDKVTGVKNPKVDVGDALFEALLEKANLKPSDVIKTGKNTFTITAEILVNYAAHDGNKYLPKGKRVAEYLSYREANGRGWIDGSFSRLLWSIACSELRN